MKRIFMPLLAIGLMAAAFGSASVATAATQAATGCTAADAAIYTPPTAVNAAPGSVLACDAVTLSQVPGNIAMKAWKVQYASTNVTGAPIAVSGTVAVPTAPWIGLGSRPVVAFNPGTLGLGPQCAFSKQLAGAYQDENEGDQIAALLKAGYAVAATDGVGYLNGQIHPYMVGRDAGHALLDAARAAFTVPGAGLQNSAPVGLWGYSEGGGASLWASQLAASYAPDLHIVGDASGGVPGDLKATASALNGGPFAGFLADADIGLSAAYPNEPFESLLNATGKAAISKAESLCLYGTLGAFLGTNISSYTTDNLTLDQIYALKGTDGTTWGQIVDAQALGVNIGMPGSSAEYQIGFPIFQYRGLAEEVIPTATEDATHQAYCAAHITTQWAEYLGDHLLTDDQAITDVISWFGQRFAGLPTSGNC